MYYLFYLYAIPDIYLYMGVNLFSCAYKLEYACSRTHLRRKYENMKFICAQVNVPFYYLLSVSCYIIRMRITSGIGFAYTQRPLVLSGVNSVPASCCISSIPQLCMLVSFRSLPAPNGPLFYRIRCNIQLSV